MSHSEQVNTGWRRIVIVVSITLGMLLAALDTMVMSTAMPDIQEILGDFQLYSWVFSAYMLASTVTVPIFGKLADMYGRKRIFSLALLLFIGGSALCGISSSMVELVIYRAVQGLGAGGVIPLTVTIAGDLYSVEKRGRIQGLFSSMWAISGIAGPVVGGWIIENWHWSWIFWMNVPIGLLAMAGFLLFNEQVEPSRQKIDYTGALTLSISILLFLFTTIVPYLWLVPLLLLMSGLTFRLFLQIERNKSHPLIRVDFFRNPMLKWVNITAFLVSMGLFAVPSFVPLFAQQVMGYDPLESGLVLMGQVLGWNILAVLSGKMIIRYGYKKSILSGISLLVAGGLILLLFASRMTYPILIGALFVMGMGFGLGMTTFTISVQEAVEPRERGISTSIQMFFRNVGATLGVSLVGGVMNMTSGLFTLQASFMFVFALSLAITFSALFTGIYVPHHVMRTPSS
ncbi:MAG: MFS transporter [Bacillaceae bacterium]|nr:MFS transporter [Bacillaceae bacterium]